MYTFTKDSVIVTAWVDCIKAGIYKREDVPNLFNLREVVYKVLDGK